MNVSSFGGVCLSVLSYPLGVRVEGERLTSGMGMKSSAGALRLSSNRVLCETPRLSLMLTTVFRFFMLKVSGVQKVAFGSSQDKYKKLLRSSY